MRFTVVFFIFFMHLYSDLITPIPTENKYDEKIVNLGRELFFDPILSKDKKISCSSCHSYFGADNKAVSLGVNGQRGTVNAPSVFNGEFNLALFWNGRAENYEAQAVEPIHNPVEMASNSILIETRLNSSKKYRELFDEVFEEKPTFSLAIKAICEFEKTLTTPNSKFDRYLRGEGSLTKEEKKGYENFKRLGCISCHNGQNVGGNAYHKFGNVIEYTLKTKNMPDRYKITGNKDDVDVFRVPPLRNVTKTAPYFHDGSVMTLKDAVMIMGYYNLGKLLNEDEVDSLIAFLKTLEGDLPKTWKANN